MLGGPECSDALNLFSKLSELFLRGKELCDDVKDLEDTSLCNLSLSCFKLNISFCIIE